jgi:hypothetical protein
MASLYCMAFFSFVSFVALVRVGDGLRASPALLPEHPDNDPKTARENAIIVIMFFISESLS